MNQGWIPHDDRTTEQRDIHETLVGEMPQFAIKGAFDDDKDVFLWKAFDAIGQQLKCFHQDIGSCVGQGKGKAEWILQAVEIANNGDREICKLPFVAYGYAQSRVCAGITGNSDGSTGSGAAEAAKKYGVLSADEPGLPSFRDDGKTIFWDGAVEREWGRRGAPQQWIEKGVKHLVKSTAPVRSAQDGWQAIGNGYPVTIASNWGGEMRPSVNDGVLLNRRADTWQHQMCVIGRMKHPKHGRLFYVQNSWGADVHGVDPAGGPAGGFWVREEDIDYIVRQDDSFAYSQFDGFPAQALDYLLI